MTTRIEFLAWDTDFFGVSIGRVDLGGVCAEELRSIDEEARDRGIDCLYGAINDPGLDDASHLAQRFGHRLVEIGLRFRRPAGSFESRRVDSTVRFGTADDVERLSDLLDSLAPWSRFAVDPRFGVLAARRMHEAWVRRAVSEADERRLVIAEDGTDVTGFLTLVRDPVPRSDLISVSRPGSGVSWAMFELFEEWAGDGEIEAGPSAARNVAAGRFYEQAGFRLFDSKYLFHRWLDEYPVEAT